MSPTSYHLLYPALFAFPVGNLYSITRARVAVKRGTGKFFASCFPRAGPLVSPAAAFQLRGLPGAALSKGVRQASPRALRRRLPACGPAARCSFRCGGAPVRSRRAARRRGACKIMAAGGVHYIIPPVDNRRAEMIEQRQKQRRLRARGVRGA